ncbi:NUDIX domain-containing protein [Metabacillus iocasae]|uniref:8-oxo-dGTP pyrophosphatase MutT (NUDIX family) n=1 Tax=Priestia iocasae TaxID=2291674 RepID=A0ABS2QTZ6_9BACI|nr:NUDIX domain-containing protein [Metabacillus iocasae]MBM7702941.1 8-oxo-dGTP pyrophosphatase MutT (NUDIX family) [Metabacillus iocasae]
MHIRNSAKAMIIKEQKVLLTKNKDEEGYFYLFPGGGQEHGETIHETLKRECIEEIGGEVSVEELIHVREYIGKNHEHASFDAHLHQIEYYFVCQLASDLSTITPTNLDDHQVGVEWIDVEDMSAYRIYPKELVKHIVRRLKNEKVPVYVGDVN